MSIKVPNFSMSHTVQNIGKQNKKEKENELEKKIYILRKRQGDKKEMCQIVR